MDIIKKIREIAKYNKCNIIYCETDKMWRIYGGQNWDDLEEPIEDKDLNKAIQKAHSRMIKNRRNNEIDN